MFTQIINTKDYSSRILLSALVLSLVGHAALLLLLTEESGSIQSGLPSRMNVSTSWSEIEIVAEKMEQKLDKQQTLGKPIKSASESITKSPTKTVKQEKKNKPKFVEKKIIAAVSSQSSFQAPETVKEITHSESYQGEKANIQKLGQEQDSKLMNKLVKKTLDEKVSQPVRYKIGTNDNPKPNYPYMAAKKGWQGEVVLGVYVKPDGSIEHLIFVKSTDYGVLNYEAYETVRLSWHFKPLEDEDALDSPTYIEVPITFNIANR